MITPTPPWSCPLANQETTVRDIKFKCSIFVSIISQKQKTLGNSNLFKFKDSIFLAIEILDVIQSLSHGVLSVSFYSTFRWQSCVEAPEAASMAVVSSTQRGWMIRCGWLDGWLDRWLIGCLAGWMVGSLVQRLRYGEIPCNSKVASHHERRELASSSGHQLGLAKFHYRFFCAEMTHNWDAANAEAVVLQTTSWILLAEKPRSDHTTYALQSIQSIQVDACKTSMIVLF